MSESTRDSLPNLSELPESSRAIAWERYQILRPHLEDLVFTASLGRSVS